LVKVSINRYVSRRFEKVRDEAERGIGKLRMRMMGDLEEIFRVAGKIVKGEIRHQRIDGKMVRITPLQRQKWLEVATCVAETIRDIAENIDEKELKARLRQIEELIESAKVSS
jgi:hypothetical protein